MTDQVRRRILAVDDNEDVLDLILMSLGDKYDVVTLCDPVDLYELLDLYEPDLLVLDIMMPKINGFQLIEMLRKNPATKELPIIILSAKTSAGEIKHGYRLGATLYLTKPFQPERLEKNVATQFEVHPPRERAKGMEGHDLSLQIELTPAFRKGHIKVSNGLQRKEKTVMSPRQRIQERIRQAQAAQQARRR